jgi:DNA-binding NarL/FixJ family response regulator
VRKILVGGFGPIARLGLRAFFDQSPFDVVAECPINNVMNQLAATSADVVVLDLDAPDTDELARLLVVHHRVTAITCSVNGSQMMVYPASGNGQSHNRELTAAALAEAARS